MVKFNGELADLELMSQPYERWSAGCGAEWAEDGAHPVYIQERL